MVAQRIGVAHRYATQVSAMCKMLRKAGTKVKKVARGKRARSLVLQGKKARTKSGLTKSDLKRNKKGRIVPKKKSEACKKNSHEHTVRWSACVQRARAMLHIVGWCPVGGQSAMGKKLLKKTKELYAAM